MWNFYLNFSHKCSHAVAATSALSKDRMKVLWTAPDQGSGCIQVGFQYRQWVTQWVSILWWHINTVVVCTFYCLPECIIRTSTLQMKGQWESRQNYNVLSPNFHIHVSVSDLYIPRIGLPILLQPIRQTDHGNI
jgi:hypothetical protein